MASPSSSVLLVLLLPVAILSVSFTVRLIAAQDVSTDNVNPQQTDSATAISQYVAAHNAARAQVGVPPLVWSAKLANFARVYAGKRRRDCSLVHSPGYAYGENIFWGQGRRWSTTDVVAAWVAEKQLYHYDTNTCSGPDCSHYTQIVWRNTKEVGCAKIICNSGDTFAVCEYYPPGNYIGARPYTIPSQKP